MGQMGQNKLGCSQPFGGKYDLLSALCGQSTTNGPKRRKLAVISSASGKVANNHWQAVSHLPAYLHQYQAEVRQQRLFLSTAPCGQCLLMKRTINTTGEGFAGYDLKLLCEVKSASKLSVSLPVKKGDFPLLRGKFRFLRCFLSSGDMFW